MIIYQIIFLQAVYYILLSLPLFLSYIAFSTELSLQTIYNANKLTYIQHATNTTTLFYALLLSYLLTIPCISAFVLVIIGRAKKCLDYVATIYILHYILCCVISGNIPSTIEYYVINITACVCTVFLSEYLCIQKELKAINLTGGYTTNGNSAPQQLKVANELDESTADIEMQLPTVKQRTAQPLLVSV